MNLLLDYTKFKRFVNGMEEMLLREVRASKEYRDFAAFFSEEELDRFVAQSLNEGGALEFQVSRMIHTEHLEICDRIIYSFYPEDVERYSPADFQEIMIRKIMNQDAFRMKTEHPECMMECEINPLPGDPDRTEDFSEKEFVILQREYEKTVEYNKKQEQGIPEYFIRRENLLKAAVGEYRKKNEAGRKAFSVTRNRL